MHTNNIHRSARDRLLFLRQDEIEQIMLCDDSDDDEENVLRLDDEDIAFLEEDDEANALVNEEFVEVIIEHGKTAELQPPPKRKRQSQPSTSSGAQIALPTLSTSSDAAETQEPNYDYNRQTMTTIAEANAGYIYDCSLTYLKSVSTMLT